MKIAVFDHIGNWGGGSRFCRALLIALKQNSPEIAITYFGSEASMAREDVVLEFATFGIDARPLSSTAPVKVGWRILAILFRVISKVLRAPTLELPAIGRVHKEIEKLAKGYDIAFFPWPYLLECPSLECPMVGVFHDFNYKYFFGSPIFTDDQYNKLNRQMVDWLSKATPVVSSKFTASELSKFYPEAASKMKIVHLAPFAISRVPQEKAAKIVRDLGIDKTYILYPTNLCQHKNIGMLLRAIYILHQRGVDLTLVITGPGTECATGRVSAHGVERVMHGADIMGLGYVSNVQMDALIQCANAVISTSLYEAGNGPGLDAWSRGVPVIMSNIPSFVEHLDVLKVKAQLIDPYDADDIAAKIYDVIVNYPQIKEAAELSRENIQRYGWHVVASRYYEIFCELTSQERDN